LTWIKVLRGDARVLAQWRGGAVVHCAA
jgi:hypothetical protein